MKEKLLALLKRKAENTQVSERTLDSIASELASFAKDDSKIEDFESLATVMISNVQNNINHVVSTQKNEWENSRENKKPSVEQQENDISKLIQEAVASQINPLKQELDSYKQKEVKQTILGDAKNKILEKYNIKDSDPVFNSIFNLCGGENTDGIVEQFSSAYEGLRKNINTTPPSDKKITAEDKEKQATDRLSYLKQAGIIDNNE